jgi:hypothetical protein
MEMQMKNRAFAVPVKLLALLIAGVSSGISANEFAARLEASSRYSDNATKASEEQNTIEERQDRYQLELSGLYENALVELGANYVASANIFQKESQDDRNLLEGDSHLRLGKPTQLFDLLLTHSRRSLRTSAEDLDLLANRDERQMLSVIPSFHLGATSADRFLVIGNYTKVDYRFNENRNSEYTGANLVWQHDFSRAHGIELSGQHTEVDFEYFPAVDYQYQAAMFSYHTSLRNLSYTLAAGYNQSKRDLDDVENSAPSFRVEVGYDTGVHQLSVYAEQRITDSSVGDGNRGELGMPRPGDLSAGTLDQIKRRSLELSWGTQALCDRCEMRVFANARKDEFLSSPQNNDEVGGGANLSYRFSHAARIGARWTRRDQDVVRNNENIKLNRSAIEYRYEFRSGIGLAVFAEHEKSKSNSGQQDYEETIGGLSLSYQY